MSASTLSNLVSIADRRAQRGMSDLTEHREKAARLRTRYQRLVTYAEDYRRSAPAMPTPSELESRQRFQIRIDEHVSALAEELRDMDRDTEALVAAARNDRASAHALQALQARHQDAGDRRNQRRAAIALDQSLALRQARRPSDTRMRGAW